MSAENDSYLDPADLARRTASDLIEQASEEPEIDLGPAVDYAGYRARDLTRLLSDVPVLLGQMPEPGSILLLSYVRAEPMSVLLHQDLDRPYSLADAIDSMAELRADALLIAGIVPDSAPDDQWLATAGVLAELALLAREHGLHPFAVVVDSFVKGGHYATADALLTGDTRRIRVRRWTQSPRTHAAIRAGAIAAPGSAGRLPAPWAPDPTALPTSAPIDPASGDYAVFLAALAAVIEHGDDAVDAQDLSIIAATASQQLGEVIAAFGDHQQARSRLAGWASRTRGRTRSRLLSAAGVLAHLDGDADSVAFALRAVDDIATSGGRTPLSEALRLHAADEIDRDEFDRVLSMADISCE